MRSRRGAALATAASAAVYVLAFPPFGWHPLAWVALAPWLAALRDAGLRERLALGVLWTACSGVGLGYWMPAAVAHYAAQSLLVGWSVLLFTVLTAVPFYLLFAALYAPLARLPGGPLLAAAALVTAELARSRLLNGSPIYFGISPGGSLGYSQASALAAVQIASWTGVYGVSFALAAVNAGLAELLDARRRWRGAAVAFAVGLCTVLFGLASLRGPDAPDAPGGVEIALVQTALDPAARWGEQGAYRTLESHLALTRDLLHERAPAIVFWPEVSVTFFLEREDPYRGAIAGLLAQRDAELVLGAPRSESTDGPPYRNSVYVLEPDGTIRARYDKQYLLPFMEYFPSGVDLLRRSFGRVRVFTPGVETAPLATRAGRAGILVCNEAMLPQFAAERVDAGAQYLVNPSNDGWIPHPSFLGQQLDMAALRAVEQRTYLVRVSDVGPSAIVDPWGRVQGRTEPLARAVLRGRIRPATERSVYGRVGDAFALACVLATALGCALALRGFADRRARSVR